MDKVMLKQLLFHGSWLVFPAVVWLLWRWRQGRQRAVLAILLLGCGVFVWARFIEPQLILVDRTTLAGTGVDTRVALISDVHLGIYKGRGYLQRVVERINALDVDAVVIAGDLTYEPRPDDLHDLFAPLAQLKAPAYVVLGNHDQQPPGRDLDKPLRQALNAHGMQIIEGRLVTDARGVRWAGLGDMWAGHDDPGFLRQPDVLPGPTVLIAHNPDSAMQLRPGDATLVLAGHTHGGQIRIPWLYRKVIPSSYGFDRGEQRMLGPHGTVRVFTTRGIGEIGLPLRLFNPPTIDVLQLRP
ncbi:metallophosphoesterase [Stenotrophomonas sp.]|uniref:metallophosphoesterase n=1 Tax=Stenotrophomonas sp. TaxID=69392 RepID=UPI0028AC6346|nr:metallophosphoesterase [Stenotrophomonas sp.]